MIEESEQKQEADSGDNGDWPGEMNLAPIAHDFNKKVRSLDVTVEGKDSEIDFSGLYLTEDTVNGLRKCGFQKPSPIQLRAIPLGRLGFDLLLQAKSGTGKTCVFSVIALESITVSTTDIQVLIMAPCREIAHQNASVLRNLGVCKEGLCVKTFIGGKPIERDPRRINMCHVAVGTPGRLSHLIREYAMDLSTIRVFILDEADKLLDSSFFKDLQTVFAALPAQKQIIAASATYPDGLDDFIMRFMKDPLKVQLDASAPVLLAVDQFALNVKKMVGYEAVEGQSMSQEETFRHKYKCLKEVLRRVEFTQAIIFCSYQLRAEKLYDELRSEGIDVVLLSGALDQYTRLESLDQLQSGKCRLMVATDLAARGIDCESVDLVINLECPTDLPTYIHRMGRAGRFGARGTVITFLVFSSEWSSIYRFQAQVNLRVSLVEDVKSLDSVGLQNYYPLTEMSTNGRGTRDNEKNNSGPDASSVWEYCKSTGGQLSLQELTLQGIHIRTEPAVILQNIAKLKAIFNEAMAEWDRAQIPPDAEVDIETMDTNGENTKCLPAENHFSIEGAKIEGSVSQLNVKTEHLPMKEASGAGDPSIPSGTDAKGASSKIDELASSSKTDSTSAIPQTNNTRALSSGLRGRGHGAHLSRNYLDDTRGYSNLTPIDHSDSDSSSMDEYGFDSD